MSEEQKQSAPQAAEVKISTRVMWLALVCIGVSGFASLAYEVLWTRALTRYLYNSTYAFTTMLATFLVGIALGSAIYSAWLSRTRRPLLLFAALQLFVGLGFLLSSFLFKDLSSVFLAYCRSISEVSAEDAMEMSMEEFHDFVKDAKLETRMINFTTMTNVFAKANGSCFRPT